MKNKKLIKGWRNQQIWKLKPLIRRMMADAQLFKWIVTITALCTLSSCGLKHVFVWTLKDVVGIFFLCFFLLILLGLLIYEGIVDLLNKRRRK